MIGPSGKDEFFISQRIDLPKEYGPLKEICSKKEGSFHVSGTLITEGGELPINIEGDILLPALPYLKIDSAGVSKDAADQLSMGFELIVANENPFKIFAKYIDYELYVEEKLIKKDKIIIEEKLTTPGFGYNISAVLHPDNLGKDLIKKVIGASQLSYKMKGEFMLENFAIPVDLSGTFNFTR